MKYYKNLMNGVVVAVTADQELVGTRAFWREATEREYNMYRAHVARVVANLEKVVAYKARVLGVDP